MHCQCPVKNSLYWAWFDSCNCRWRFFSQKCFFSVNDMLFSNSYFNYIIRYFHGFEGLIVSRHFQSMKIWIDKKTINFANFTTFINITKARLPTSASLCQAGTHILYYHNLHTCNLWPCSLNFRKTEQKLSLNAQLCGPS